VHACLTCSGACGNILCISNSNIALAPQCFQAMKLTIQSRSGRELIAGGLDLPAEVPQSSAHLLSVVLYLNVCSTEPLS